MPNVTIEIEGSISVRETLRFSNGASGRVKQIISLDPYLVELSNVRGNPVTGPYRTATRNGEVVRVAGIKTLSEAEKIKMRTKRPATKKKKVRSYTNIFTTILDNAKLNGRIPSMQKSSRDYFRNKGRMSGAHPTDIIGKLPDNRMIQGGTGRRLVGSMFFYVYDPKTKEKLPYYDAFPLVFPIEMAPSGFSKKGKSEPGFYGLNVHYLQPTVRAQVMDALWATATNENLDANTRLKINWQILKQAAGTRAAKFATKAYLFSHIKGDMHKVYANEWDVALFLPVAQWRSDKKGSRLKQVQRKVYTDYKKK